MGASVGKSMGPMAGINITPLVDVVLVLLIIFMLVVKGDSTFIPNAVPKKAEAEEAVAIENEQLVLEILKDNSALLNRNPMTKEGFPEYFRKLIQERADKKLFVSVDDEVLYKEVVYWMSMARKNGATLVALQIKPPDYDTIIASPPPTN